MEISLVGILVGLMALAPVRRIYRAVIKDLGVPEDMLTFVNYPTRFDRRETDAALKGSGMLAKARELAAAHGWFLPSQFDNEANAQVHERTTAVESVLALDDPVGQAISGIVHVSAVQPHQTLAELGAAKPPAKTQCPSAWSRSLNA